MIRAQGIRPTQFITSYGPGTILEGIHGPRLIQSFELSGLFRNQQVHRYEIVEPALRQVLDDGRIFRLPTNADLSQADQDSIYETTPFPRWSLCVKHNVLYQYKYGETRACPHCKGPSDKGALWQKSREEAISLIVACPKGHLDEIHWPSHVHRSGGCASQHFLWKARGSSLKNVDIECPDCKASLNLGQEFLREHSCRGRFPEQGKQDPCTAKARVLQRGAANVYRTQLVSSITVPRLSSPLVRALKHTAVINFLPVFTATQLQERVGTFIGFPSELKALIQAADPARLAEAMAAAQEQGSLAQNEEQARSQELRELMRAAEEGYRTADGRPGEFEVDPHQVVHFEYGPVRLRITPIQRLRVVMVQTGYTRMEGFEPVSCAYQHGSETWYPGVELFGEGLFLDFHLPDFQQPRWREWMRLYESSKVSDHHPALVWWHTLSHRLIRALSIYSGYSSASVRERLYVQIDDQGRGQGGLLLYAVQPGGDGTLGGLLALVPRFDRVLAEALDDLDACSNDPFCEESQLSNQPPQGAACYACCLTSETSCERRNHSLDRLLLKQTLEA